MRKLFLSVLPIVLVLLSLFTILSCDKGEPEVKEQGVSLFLAVADQVSIGVATVPLSKLAKPDNDDRIVNLWILQFNSSEKLVTKIFIDSEVTTSTLVSLKSNDSGLKYTLRLVANTNAALFNAISDNGTYDLSTFRGLTIPTSTSVTADCIPMIGEMNNVVINPNTTQIGKSSPCEMYRLYAKVALGYEVANHLKYSAGLNGDYLKVTGVNLVGIPKNIPLTREVSPSANFTDPGALETISFVFGPESSNTEERANGVLYLPQNLGGLGTSSLYKSGFGTNNSNKLAHIEFLTTYFNGTAEQNVKFKVYLGNDEAINYNVLSNIQYNVTVGLNDVDFENPTITSY